MSPNLPMCLTCNRLVDKMIVYEDVDTQSTVVIVRCHGQEERGELSPFDKSALLNGKLVWHCFAPKLSLLQ